MSYIIIVYQSVGPNQQLLLYCSFTSFHVIFTLLARACQLLQNTFITRHTHKVSRATLDTFASIQNATMTTVTKSQLVFTTCETHTHTHTHTHIHTHTHTHTQHNIITLSLTHKHPSCTLPDSLKRLFYFFFILFFSQQNVMNDSNMTNTILDTFSVKYSFPHFTFLFNCSLQKQEQQICGFDCAFK